MDLQTKILSELSAATGLNFTELEESSTKISECCIQHTNGGGNRCEIGDLSLVFHVSDMQLKIRIFTVNGVQPSIPERIIKISLE